MTRERPPYRAINTEMLEILLALSGGPLHGFGIVQAVKGHTEGSVILAPSLLYRRLKGLLEAELVEEVGEAAGERGRKRKYYDLTVTGKQVLAAEARRLRELAGAERVRRAAGGAQPA